MVYDNVVEAVKSRTSQLEVTHHLLHSAMDVLNKASQDGPDFKLKTSIEIRPLMSYLRESNEETYQKTAQDFMTHFADRE